ncbi:MAG: hypothetical protein ACREQI_09830 [Candidatus Binataceae bacterium]
MFFAAAALIIVGVALFVAAPLGSGLAAAHRKSASELDLMRLEHERGLAVQGLRELDFDREMGKLSTADFESLRATLETRALAAMEAIDKLRKPMRRPPIVLVTPIEPAPELHPAHKNGQPAAAEPAPHKVVPLRHAEAVAPPEPPPAARADSARPAAAARAFRFCPRCGARTGAGANFCAECGITIQRAARASIGTD